MMRQATIAFAGLMIISAPLTAQDGDNSLSFSQSIVSEEMVAAADALLATIDAGQRRQRMLGISKVEALQMSLEDDARKGDLSTNMLLEPGDIIYVPPTILARIGYAIQSILFPFQPILGTARTLGGQALVF